MLIIDWIIKQTTAQGKSRIQRTVWKKLEDLDFADDIILLSHIQQQIQDKMVRMAEVAGSVGLRIDKGKSKILKINTKPGPYYIGK